MWVQEFGKLSQGPYQERKKEQAGAELCQAQFKLWLAKVAVFFYLIESLGHLQFK